MLDWDPTGAGPGDRNDRFVMEVLRREMAHGLGPSRRGHQIASPRITFVRLHRLRATQ